MADQADQWPENVPGKFFVDGQCIDCDLCREIAPRHFKREMSGGYSYVALQPSGEEEQNLCQEALESCPVGAIGRREEKN
ncbi:MAG: ferredoxin [Puniceicoccales bacterium]|jgi:ferredoxin|nr:ferredoxin [Puniceicoccales bacterium]